MDGKRIIYTRPDGGVSIIIPAPGAAREDVLRAVPEGIEWREVAAAEIPTDRTFRDAWQADLTVNMETARGIHRDRLRAARAPRLAALDVEQLRGRDVEAEKRTLRDLPADPRIAAAQTPEQLAALTLDVLTAG